MFKEPDGFSPPLFTRQTLLCCQLRLLKKRKEVLHLGRNTIQSNGKATVGLSHFVRAASAAHCSVGIYCSLEGECTVTLAPGGVYQDELITTTAHWCFP